MNAATTDYRRGFFDGLAAASDADPSLLRPMLGASAAAVVLPMKLQNASNGSHGHWVRVSAIAEEQREQVKLAVRKPLRDAQIVRARPGLVKTTATGRVRSDRVELAVEKLAVLVTRLAPSGGLDPHDGLRRAAKHAVDGIADALGLSSDRDARVLWLYAQETSGRRGLYKARFEFFVLKETSS